MTEYGKLLYVIFTGVILIGLFIAMWRGASEALRKEAAEE